MPSSHWSAEKHLGEPLLLEKRTTAHWPGHLTMVGQLAGSANWFASAWGVWGGGGGSAVASTPAGSLAPWKERRRADPRSHWPPGRSGATLPRCRGGRGTERVLLRRDPGRRDATRWGLPLPELRAEAPEPGVSGERSRSSGALHPRPAPVSWKHTWRATPAGLTKGASLCIRLRFLPSVPFIVYPSRVYRVLYLAFWPHLLPHLSKSLFLSDGALKNSDREPNGGGAVRTRG